MDCGALIDDFNDVVSASGNDTDLIDGFACLFGGNQVPKASE